MLPLGRGDGLVAGLDFNQKAENLPMSVSFQLLLYTRRYTIGSLRITKTLKNEKSLQDFIQIKNQTSVLFHHQITIR